MVSPHSSMLDALHLSPEIDIEDVWNCEDHPNSDWISFDDPDQGYVEVQLAAPVPPNKPKVQAPISNESSIGDYCMFA